MAEQEKWQWQEPGTAWKGVGLYHITLTITDRQPLLGTLVIPENDPTKARVNRTALGNGLVNCLLSIPQHHPEVQVLHFCLMPDHLHAVLYVRRTMPSGIGALVRGFWQATKKLGRAWTAAGVAFGLSFFSPNDIRGNFQEGRGETQEGRGETQEERGNYQEGRGDSGGVQEGATGRSLQETTERLQAFAAGLRGEMGEEAYYRLAPIFTEMPFIRPMGHNTQLPNTIRYIDMNPQRHGGRDMPTDISGDPVGIQTQDLQNRNLTLYSAKLRDQ